VIVRRPTLICHLDLVIIGSKSHASRVEGVDVKNGGMASTPTEPGVRSPGSRRLLDRVRDAVRVRHYSRRTEDAYVGWIRRFILFHGKGHPLEMGSTEINAFLTDLAVRGHVSASTQNQAFSSLLFLYRTVLEVDPGVLDGAVRASRPRRLPVVLTRVEVAAVLDRLDGVPQHRHSLRASVRRRGD